MEGFFAAVEFLAKHPVAAVLLEVAIFPVLFVLYRMIKRESGEAAEGRKKLHLKIENNKTEINGHIDEMRRDFNEHERSDATFHATISTALKFLVLKANGGGQLPPGLFEDSK